MNDNQKILLNNWINASKHYYDINLEPIMTDEEFDSLTEELQSFDDNEINAIVSKSIQQTDGFVSAQLTEMISLKKEKYLSKAAIIPALKFLGYNLSNFHNKIWYAPKFDGIAVKIIFDMNKSIEEKTKIKTILTRGGQDITDLLKNHKDLKFYQEELIKISPSGIIHGELVLSKNTFEGFYSEEYANPRNAVVGVLKQNINDLNIMFCTNGISPLQGTPLWKVLQNPNDLETIYKEYKSENFPYQVDGIVIGFTTEKQIIKENYPTNLLALKFPAPTAKTVCIGIEYTQKKSGNLTPIILIKPISLDGSVIQKVAGYNYMHLKTSHIGIGSELLITKSGDIIPIVKKVLTYSNNIPMPKCAYIINGKNLKAVNDMDSKIFKFVSGLRLLQIDGIGETIAETIGKIVDFEIIELFNTLNKPDIRRVLGDGKVWQNFAIFYESKTITLDMLINILQFNGCGKVLSKKFANIISNGDKDVSNIDKKLLMYVCKEEGFTIIKNSITKLKEYGITVVKPVLISDDCITFEMTGNPCNNMTKEQFITRFKKLYPNSNHISLTKETKYLIVDSLTTSSGKANKARKYNTKIITYEQALKDVLL